MADESRSEAGRLADEARDMLVRLNEFERVITERHKDEMKRVQDSVSGATAQINRNNEWTVQIATATALASIALSLASSGGRPNEV